MHWSVCRSLLCNLRAVLAGDWRSHLAQWHLLDAWAMAQKLHRSFAYDAMPLSSTSAVAAAAAQQQASPAVEPGSPAMGTQHPLASSLIARLLSRHRWIAWVGLAVILYVAVRMIYEGADQILGHSLPSIPLIKGPIPLPFLPLPAF